MNTIDKASLRRSLKQARAALTPDEKNRADACIGERLLAWWHASGHTALAVYWPLQGEPDLGAAYAVLADAGVQLALPVVLERHAPLAFAAWEPGEAMLVDQMGVAVPAQQRLVACPPALVIPCLGFNKDGYRLGYGGGYYDRTLAIAPRAKTVGVAYACQQAAFAGAAHDIALDLILTEAAA
ncbi:MAG: 5-formyltetrahydrofolate cyclo-ligase [Massilia sp.]